MPKKNMSRKKKTAIIIVSVVITIIAIAVITFWVTFFPNPFAKSVSPSEISSGMVSMTGDSDILVAYFTLAGNRNYTSDKMDVVSSASLKIHDGQVLGHAEIFALAAQGTTDGLSARNENSVIKFLTDIGYAQ